MLRVIPKDGLKVINPDTMKRVPKEGSVIPKKTTYWNRREKDGDVTISKITAKKPSKKQETK